MRRRRRLIGIWQNRLTLRRAAQIILEERNAAKRDFRALAELYRGLLSRFEELREFAKDANADAAEAWKEIARTSAAFKAYRRAHRSTAAARKARKRERS